jgi:integrase
LYRRRVIRGQAGAYPTLRDRFTHRTKDFWLGSYGSPESHQAYARLVAQWTIREGRIPDAVIDTPKDVLTIDGLVDAWWNAEGVHFGFSHQHMVRSSLDILCSLFGSTAAVDFGPLALRAVRDRMLAGDPEQKPPRKPWSRKTVNLQVNRLRQMFRWAAGQQLLPIFVYDTLRAVENLKAGRSTVPEPKAIGPVQTTHVDAIEDHVSAQMWGMICLQLHTGMRPGEVCRLRPADLDMNDNAMRVYRPAHHKTAHRGRTRIVSLGPRAIEVIRPYVTGRRIDAALFSPTEAETARREDKHQARVTPLQYGNRPGTNRRIDPKKKPGERYVVEQAYTSLDDALRDSFDVALVATPSHLRVPMATALADRSPRHAWHRPFWTREGACNPSRSPAEALRRKQFP